MVFGVSMDVDGDANPRVLKKEIANITTAPSVDGQDDNFQVVLME